jgi:hypothetical protein
MCDGLYYEEESAIAAWLRRGRWRFYRWLGFQQVGPLGVGPWRFVRFCDHAFNLAALKKNPSARADESDRVIWPCAKCGRVFTAHCGLDISPKHGLIVPRSVPSVGRAPAASVTPSETRGGAS